MGDGGLDAAENRVEKVLRSFTLSSGALIWLWKWPAYSFDAVRGGGGDRGASGILRIARLFSPGGWY